MAKKQTAKPKAPAVNLSPEVSSTSAETPPEVLGVSPPVAPLSIPPAVVIEHGVDSPIVIEPAKVVTLEVETPASPSLEAPDNIPAPLDETHPAIAVAARHPAGHGAPAKRTGTRYLLPPPPEIIPSV